MSTQRYKGKLADNYKLLLKGWSHIDSLRKVLAEEIKKYSQIKGGVLDVLEVGTGYGETTRFIFEINPEVKITAVDINQTMLDGLVLELAEYKDRLQVVCKDIFDYIKEIKDGSVDVFSSSWALHNFPSKLRGILYKDIYRILKPGGLFVNMDKYLPDDDDLEEKLFQEAFKNLDYLDDEGRADLKEEMIKHEMEDRSPELKMKETKTMQEMKLAGFKNCKIVDRKARDAVLVCFK